MISLKTKQEIDIMDEANQIVHDVLNQLIPHISSGINTRELDKIAEDLLQWSSHLASAIPAFKGYMGYPSSLCISINEEIVHGIPGDRIIQNGDIISVDFGVIHKGFVGDAAKTIIVGNTTEEVTNLSQRCKEALLLGIDQMRVGRRLHHIGEAISAVAKKYNYGNIKSFCGHGIGKKMHEDPPVFNYIKLTEPSVRLREGMVLALEPMFTLGTSDTEVLKDGWTAVTKDRSMAAHWEVSVAITDGDPRILGTKIGDI